MITKDDINGQAIEAEQAVLGSILIEPKCFGKIIPILKAEDFSVQQHIDTYSAMLEISAEGKPIDPVLVLNKLSPKYKNEAELKKYMFQLAQMVPSAANAEAYAKIVANEHKARKLMSIATEILESGVTAENANEIAESAMSDIYGLTAPNTKKRLVPIKDGIVELLNSYAPENADKTSRVETGYSKIDKKLMGMNGGNLIILAARPKVGKTAFAASIGLNVARTMGRTVAMYSCEMGHLEILERMLSNASDVKMDSLLNRSFNDKSRPEEARKSEWAQVGQGASSLYKLPILINDNPSITVNNIMSECRTVKNLGLIIVDYIQLMKSTKKTESRNLEIGAISRELKVLAGELNVPVLALSQLNRTSDEFSRPSSTELRDSGELEQNVNKLMLMWCIKENKDENDRTISKVVGLDVNLNRGGGTGVTELLFDNFHMRFSELEQRYEEQPKRRKRDWRDEE